MRPRLLRADNLTPPTRTPWGGERILSRYKDGLEVTPQSVVGESWEVSVEPSFPSRFDDDGTLLADAISTDPNGWLGHGVAARYGGQTPLLIKLLDSADNLSVQVHPQDGDTALGPDESGKPEAWIILDAEPGAGLYLGFREGITREDVAACLRDQGPLDTLMNFVPVTSGDAFVIAAGTAHAIGAGVTLVEPQFVTPGRRGLTYRFWDWNRRYDGRGRRDPQGSPRELHVTRSLEVTAWDHPGGDPFVEGCRAAPQHLSSGSGTLTRARVIDWPWFMTERWTGTGEMNLPPFGTLLALTAVKGHGALHTPKHTLAVRRGQSVVVPADARPLTVSGEGLDLLATYSSPT
ncbi:MAG: type I phosphomannose isomerase catalytic subunit [Myxococcota bacterium]